jgi:hypothetical protein
MFTKINKMESTRLSSQDIDNILGQLINPNKEIDQTGRFTVQCIVEIVSEHGVEDFEYPNDGYFKFKHGVEDFEYPNDGYFKFKTIKEAYNFKYPKKYKECEKQITEYTHDDETYGDAGDYTYWNYDLGSTYFSNIDGTEKNLEEYYHNEY